MKVVYTVKLAGIAAISLLLAACGTTVSPITRSTNNVNTRPTTTSPAATAAGGGLAVGLPVTQAAATQTPAVQIIIVTATPAEVVQASTPTIANTEAPTAQPTTEPATPVPPTAEPTVVETTAAPTLPPTATPAVAAAAPTTAGATPAAAAASAAGDPNKGKTIFNGVGTCNTCHNVTSNATLVGPALKGLASRAGKTKPGLNAEAYIRESILLPNKYLVKGFAQGLMPQTFKQTLNTRQLNDLVAYLLTLK